MDSHNIIVVGASYGGVEALKELVSLLPRDLPASVFIALHHRPDTESLLPGILAFNGPLPAFLPENGDPFAPGNIYVARPNYHMLVKSDHIAIRRYIMSGALNLVPAVVNNRRRSL